MEVRARLRGWLVWAVLVATAFAMHSSRAHAGEADPGFRPSVLHVDQGKRAACSRCGSQQCECELICCPKKVNESEAKPFWKVTCKHVCIPGFRFPWECNKNASGSEWLVCGTVRAVNVLEQEEHECETCGYKWEVKCVRRIEERGRQDCQCPLCGRREQVPRESESRPARQ